MRDRSGILTVLGLAAFCVGVGVLSEAAWWRVVIGAWMLYLGVQAAVAVVLTHLHKKD